MRHILNESQAHPSHISQPVTFVLIFTPIFLHAWLPDALLCITPDAEAWARAKRKNNRGSFAQDDSVVVASVQRHGLDY